MFAVGLDNPALYCNKKGYWGKRLTNFLRMYKEYVECLTYQIPKATGLINQCLYAEIATQFPSTPGDTPATFGDLGWLNLF